MNRRESLRLLGGAAVFPALASGDEEKDLFKLRYIVSSAMYGEMPLDVILPEVPEGLRRHRAPSHQSAHADFRVRDTRYR